ncbi:Spore germination protein [Bacillus sp. OV322]|uniref:GerAB/ArcD/ProY family transporter n=1 Tax=Bacillus sp. OV322 TaxID=1882764 RepID=UPI0008F2F011|nr:GerAB/ArcD/ProY family transporter [Bacillus sp. OV322]SFC92412.1 Spore germination protein [Bacillus sp. OV322]
MSRYFYYLVIMCMSLNIVINVPMVLVQERFNGAIMSILISIPVGTFLAYFFTKAMSRYKSKGLPEVFAEELPKYVSIPYLFFLGMMWILSGTFAVVSFSYIIKLYLMPEMDVRVITGLLIATVIFGAARQTKSVMFLTEIIIIITFPLVAFILFKAVTSDFFYPIHVLRELHFTWQWPSYSSICASTYLFTGYINLGIANRYIDSSKVLRFFWLVPVLGTLIIISTFFIPLGFFGIEAIGDFVYPWLITADTLKMEYGFIERVSFFFLLVFLLLSLLFGIVTWHIGLKLIIGMVAGAKRGKRRLLSQRAYSFIFLAAVGAGTLVLGESVNQREFFTIVRYWLNFRLPAEVLLVLTILLMSLRRKNT